MDYAVWEAALTIIGPAATTVGDDDKSIVDQAAHANNPWLVAAEIADLFALRSLATGGITKVTAEGATFEKRRADWVALAAALRKKAGQAGADDHAFVVAPPCPPRRGPELTGYPSWTF